MLDEQSPTTEGKRTALRQVREAEIWSCQGGKTHPSHSHPQSGEITKV